MNPFSLFDIFTLDQASHAVTGIIDPANPQEEESIKLTFEALKRAIQDKQLNPFEWVEAHFINYNRYTGRYLGDSTEIVWEKTTVTRASLLKWCEQKRIRPAMLFPVPTLEIAVSPIDEIQPKRPPQRADDWAKEIMAARERVMLRGNCPDDPVAVWADMITAGATETKDRAKEPALEKIGIDKLLPNSAFRKRLKSYKRQ